MGLVFIMVWVNDLFKLCIYIVGWVLCGIVRYLRIEIFVGVMIICYGRIIIIKWKGCW